MTFSNSYVFPGGVVDATDKLDVWKTVLPKVKEEYLEETGMTQRVELSALRLAAVRETYEEVGVFLGQGHPTPNTSLPFFDRCTEKATPSLHSLHYFCRFITGLNFKIRFDTTFFVAETPNISSIALSTSESKAFRWVSPLQALNLFESRLMKMYPPQLYVLYLLSHVLNPESLFELCEKAGKLPILPAFHYVEGTTGVNVLLPGDQHYPHPLSWHSTGKHKVALDLIEGLSFDISPGISSFIDHSPFSVIKKKNIWLRVAKTS